jgi:hypothetical protein
MGGSQWAVAARGATHARGDSWVRRSGGLRTGLQLAVRFSGALPLATAAADAPRSSHPGTRKPQLRVAAPTKGPAGTRAAIAGELRGSELGVSLKRRAVVRRRRRRAVETEYPEQVAARCSPAFAGKNEPPSTDLKFRTGFLLSHDLACEPALSHPRASTPRSGATSLPSPRSQRTSGGRAEPNAALARCACRRNHDCIPSACAASAWRQRQAPGRLSLV